MCACACLCQGERGRAGRRALLLETRPAACACRRAQPSRRIVLGSASGPRKKVMDDVCGVYEVVPSFVDEAALRAPRESADEYVLAVAREKVRASP